MTSIQIADRETVLRQTIGRVSYCRANAVNDLETIARWARRVMETDPDAHETFRAIASLAELSVRLNKEEE